MTLTTFKWSQACCDAYQPLVSVKGWKRCKKCNEFPRVWEFDNGLHAKCCCGTLYGPSQARAESILSVYKRTYATQEYSRDSLRTAWNRFVETGIAQDTLPEGRW